MNRYYHFTCQDSGQSLGLHRGHTLEAALAAMYADAGADPEDWRPWDLTYQAFEVGDRVEAIDAIAEDADAGIVLDVDPKREDALYVGWDSGVRTWIAPERVEVAA